MAQGFEAFTEELAQRPIAYLLTVSAEGHPHIAEAFPQGPVETGPDHWAITVTGIGRTSGRNIDAGSQISLVWPPTAAGGYTLIVDGDTLPEEGTAEVGVLELSLTRAVLHRPGPVEPGTSACGSDCRPLLG